MTLDVLRRKRIESRMLPPAQSMNALIRKLGERKYTTLSTIFPSAQEGSVDRGAFEGYVGKKLGKLNLRNITRDTADIIVEHDVPDTILALALSQHYFKGIRGPVSLLDLCFSQEQDSEMIYSNISVTGDTEWFSINAEELDLTNQLELVKKAGKAVEKINAERQKRDLVILQNVQQGNIVENDVKKISTGTYRARLILKPTIIEGDAYADYISYLSLVIKITGTHKTSDGKLEKIDLEIDPKDSNIKIILV